MQITQRKAKDSEFSADVFARLQKVDISGWIDEDGEQVSSAVIEIVDKPISDKGVNKLSKHIRLFQNAWEVAGKEIRAGQPYLSRSGLIQYLMHTMELTEASASIYVRPSSKGKMIGELLSAQVIEPYEHGWIVLDPVQASAMLLRS